MPQKGSMSTILVDQSLDQDATREWSDYLTNTNELPKKFSYLKEL